MLFTDGKLAGDTTLTGLLATPPPGYVQAIFYQSAPAGAEFPVIVINKQTGVPTQAFQDPQALDTDVWLIKGIAHDSSADTVEAIADRIKTLLNDASLSISGEVCLYLRRMSDIDYEELSSGETYKHCGHLFRLTVDP